MSGKQRARRRRARRWAKARNKKENEQLDRLDQIIADDQPRIRYMKPRSPIWIDDTQTHYHWRDGK